MSASLCVLATLCVSLTGGMSEPGTDYIPTSLCVRHRRCVPGINCRKLVRFNNFLFTYALLFTYIDGYANERVNGWECVKYTILISIRTYRHKKNVLLSFLNKIKMHILK